MADLIDRQELISWLSKDPLFPQVEAFGLTSVIEGRPSVDAEPVRHGHWMKRSKVYPGLPYDHTYHYECSNCGWMDAAGEDVEVPYCWHCGAKMDERREDETD